MGGLEILLLSLPHTVTLVQLHPGMFLQELGKWLQSLGFFVEVHYSIVARLDELEAGSLLDFQLTHIHLVKGSYRGYLLNYSGTKLKF